MSSRTEPSRRARRSLLALVFVGLLAPMVLSGCIPLCIIVPGSDCNDNPWLFGDGGERSYCDYDHEVEEAKKTPYGWVGIYHSEVDCSWGRTEWEELYDTGEWRVVGFSKKKPEDKQARGYTQVSGSDGSEDVCKSCALRILTDHEIEDLEVKTWQPFWMRVSAKARGPKWPRNYVVSTNASTGAVTAAQCKGRIPGDQAPSMMTCLGPIGEGRWEKMAAELDNPTVFDKQALAWVAEHRRDPAKMVEGLTYFANTWEAAAGQRTPETVESLRNIVQDTGCSPMLGAGGHVWLSYLSALDKIVGSAQREGTVEACFVRLAADQPELLGQPELLEQIESPFITPKVIAAFDEAMSTRAKAGQEVPLELWLDRLDEEPAPPEELVAQMDQLLFEQLPESAAQTHKRLEHPAPIAPANATLLRDKIIANHLGDTKLTWFAFERPEMEVHRDTIDLALVDALSEGPIAGGVRSTFTRRILRLEAFPLSSSNLARLQDVLVSNIDALADEAFATLVHTDEPTRQPLLTRLDAQVAESFPAGSQFFLMRLSRDSFGRPKPAVAKAILEKAQAMKEQGVSFDHAACQVVRRLSFLPTDSGACELPDNL